MRAGRRLAGLALLLGTSCGSGGGGADPPRLYDPVTHVSLVGSVPGDDMGTSWWTQGGSGIWLEGEWPEWERVATLKHELWHCLTLIEGHPNEVGCISHPNRFLFIEQPCAVELAQVEAAGRVVLLSFPEDREAAIEAADWWNAAAGRECVRVVE